jgi:hypothetical protein
MAIVPNVDKYNVGSELVFSPLKHQKPNPITALSPTCFIDILLLKQVIIIIKYVVKDNMTPRQRIILPTRNFEDNFDCVRVFPINILGL